MTDIFLILVKDEHLKREAGGKHSRNILGLILLGGTKTDTFLIL